MICSSLLLNLILEDSQPATVRLDRAPLRLTSEFELFWLFRRPIHDLFVHLPNFLLSVRKLHLDFVSESDSDRGTVLGADMKTTPSPI